MQSNCFLQSAPTADLIPHTPKYYPFQTGRYQVKPGLFPLGYDFGNGDLDRQLFQLDQGFAIYRQIKLAARRENLAKYYQTYQYNHDNHDLSREISQLLISRLIQEYPQYFRYEQLCDGDFALHCHLTQEVLYFDCQYRLQLVQTVTDLQTDPTPNYTCTLDAIASQIQADIAVVCRCPETGDNWVSAIHLCFPNHWSAQSKIGQDFATVHLPVAGIKPINQRANALVKAMIDAQPMVRFAWGISTDTRLNHHPQPAPGIDPQIWNGRKFSIDHPQLYLRVERQVMWGLPQVNAALFTIRTYFYDCAIVCRENYLRNQLINAIQSMSLDALIYKGLLDSKDDIVNWLKGFDNIKV